MKKLMIAVLASGALSVPAMAYGQGIDDQFRGQTFSNRGQCQSALAQARNERRQDPNLRPGNRELSNSEYNALIAQRYRCAQNSDGTWSVRRNR